MRNNTYRINRQKGEKKSVTTKTITITITTK